MPNRKDLESVPAWPPVPGFYATALVKGGPRVAIRIWYGLPIIGDEEQDRGPRWNVSVDGRTDRWERDEGNIYRCRVAFDVDRFWPYCAREPITEAEYRFLVADAEWTREHAPNHPKARPHKPVDFNTLLPF
jgi:hypothetical protein